MIQSPWFVFPNSSPPRFGKQVPEIEISNPPCELWKCASSRELAALEKESKCRVIGGITLDISQSRFSFELVGEV